MNETFSEEFERAVRFLTAHAPAAQEHKRKPLLSHALRVGVYLYENGHKQDVVVAGLLHDTLEWMGITEQILQREFGNRVTKYVRACTKDDSIADKQQKTDDLVKRCIKSGQGALIVKAADILDSFRWYTRQRNHEQLDYCKRNAKSILKWKPARFHDPIFKEICKWNSK